MKLFDIMQGIGYQLVQGANAEIESLTIDSRSAGCGSMFFCIKGFRSDGHAFAGDSARQGAAAIVAEDNVSVPDNVAVVRVADTRQALAYAAANFYGRPADNLVLLGVTGTNGKTSTTYFLEAILKEYGKESGVIGTVGFRAGGKELDVHTATSTTPDTIELHQMLYKMQGVDHVVMEVTSHALALNKVEGLRFKTGIFTNLTQDHLDLHGTMEEYRDVKSRFFAMCENSIINVDDPYGEGMIGSAAGKVITYSIDNDSDLKAEDVRLLEKGCSFSLKIDGKDEEFFIPVRGRFTVYNCLGVIGAAYSIGVPVDVIKSGLRKLEGVPGRIQSVKNDLGFDVIVDYSHTPDSLKNIIDAVREITKGRIITVFGCGGDRDRTKRPIMGRIAGGLSDYCIITSDNPRTENPESILAEIEPGVAETGCAYEKVTDRHEAIERAIELANPGDTVIIAGKGHENYQIFAEKTIHFDDKEVAEEAIKNHKKGVE